MKKTTNTPPKQKFTKRLVIAMGLILLLIAIVVGVLDLLDLCVRKTTTQTHTYAFNGATLSFGDLSDSTVHITAGSAGKIVVTRNITQGIRKAMISERVSDSTITLAQTGCNGVVKLGLYGNCTISYTIAVPSTTAIIAKGSNATFNVSRINGDLAIQTGSGRIDVNNIQTGHLSLRSTDSDIVLNSVTASATIQAISGGGKVSLNHVTSPSINARSTDSDVIATVLTSTTVDATSGAGKVNLAFINSPAKLTARSTDSDVTIHVPHNSVPYNITAKSTESTVTTRIKTDPNTTKNMITALSGAGNVLISY
jgi:hypothetical protein